MGSSWAIIPEIYGFLDPDSLPLFKHHSRQDVLESMRENFNPPDEIWICSTDGKLEKQSQKLLRQWHQLLLETGCSVSLRIWVAKDTSNQDSKEEVERYRELTFRLALLASKKTQESGQLIISLAGGRKTMSADMQKAANLFGCKALLHIVNSSLTPDLFYDKNNIESFLKPLPKQAAKTNQKTKEVYQVNCVDTLMPLIVEYNLPTNDVVQVVLPDQEIQAINVINFQLPQASADGKVTYFSDNEKSLVQDIFQREQQGQRLFSNFLQTIAKEEDYTNWRLLYRLPPHLIEKLRKTPITQTGIFNYAWLKNLPKADIHRHLGGCLNIDEQIIVAEVVWEKMTDKEREHALERVKSLLSRNEWGFNWTALLKPRTGELPVVRSHFAATLLTKCNYDILKHNLFEVTEPRVGLKNTRGFAAYELPGELSGSAILQHEAAIEPYATMLKKQADDDNLLYVELRGSPQKYLGGDGLQFLSLLKEQLDERFSFIIIADRRQPERLAEVVKLAVEAKHELSGFIVGLDMAGDEGTNEPEKLSKYFTPAFEACLPITIHAGEGEDANKIWQAAYHLHADRIGHGLTLNKHSDLLQRFRDRGICLELCPSSNREVVGFKDKAFEDSLSYPLYPLDELWKQGVPLTICTDNPGISNTTLSDEYLTAARMMNADLTAWDALAMIKQAFVYAFVDEKTKGSIMGKAEKLIFDQLSSMQ